MNHADRHLPILFKSNKCRKKRDVADKVFSTVYRVNDPPYRRRPLLSPRLLSEYPKIRVL